MKLALVGCGFIGRTHSFALRALREAGHTDARVATTFDLDADRAVRFARAHPGCRTTESLADALEGVDAVFVCTPTSSHLPVVREAAARGLAVFCEKPLAPTLGEAEELAGVISQAGVANQAGLVLRHAPVFRALKTALDGDRAGPVMAAVLRDDQFFPNQGHYGSTWRTDVAVAGGGALIEHSIHDLDVLAWLLGPVERVSASSANFAGHPGIEDAAFAHLVHRGGCTSTLVTLWHQILSRPSGRRLEVFGRDALLWLDEDQVGPLHQETSQAHTEEGPDAAFRALSVSLPVPPDRQDALAVYASATLDFLRAVEGGTAPSPSVQDALEAQRLADAVYRSAASGDSVNIALR